MRAPLCAGPEYTDDFSNAMLEELDNEVVHSMLAGLSESKVLRVNTMCAGSESPLLCLQSLEKVFNIRGATVKFRHGFSSEFNLHKVDFISKAFPQIKDDMETGALQNVIQEAQTCIHNAAAWQQQGGTRSWIQHAF